MNLNDTRIGFALCGSFCTIGAVLPVMAELVERGASVTPIMSAVAYGTDTRFGTAHALVSDVERITGKRVLHTLPEVEPIGPRHLLDVLVIAPVTGNTLAKLANGISDTSVTFAAKAHLRNAMPLVLSISTNDGLSANAANIGKLANTKYIYLVPYTQDEPIAKPASVMSDTSLIISTIELALSGKQLQPMLIH